ncbi:hypothetical protein BSKO_12470 [Bryopsis sp. KO-2023]|nr:hypothetical protein BSKO_12470 [Bryopsis sp. KO-2023]
MNEAIVIHTRKHVAEASSSSASTSTDSFSLRIPKRALSRKDTTGPSPKLRYNLFKDVVFKAELIQESAIGWLMGTIYWAVGLGTAGLLVLGVLKVLRSFDSPEAGLRYNRVNAVVASLTTIAMFVATGFYIARVIDVTRRGFRWSLRRRRDAILAGSLFVSQSLNSLFYLLPNLLQLYDPATLATPAFEWLGVLRESMWNNIFLIFVLKARCLNLWLDKEGRPVGRKDAMLLDAPWSKHWWLFLIWFSFQGVFGALLFLRYMHPELLVGHQIELGKVVRCHMPTAMIVLVGILNAMLLLYHILGMFFIWRGYKQLVKRPYNMFRGMHIELRYHFLCSGTVGDLISISFMCLFWVRYNSCATGILSWFGILPCQFVMTVLAIVMCIFDMPVKPGRRVTLALHQNPLVWREEEVEFGDDCGIEGGCTPPFCFEMSVKLWYWSLAVYGYDPATERCFDPKYPQMSFKVAMLMYDLRHYEYIQEEICDTNVLIAWNHCTILVCFRGTYSASNVWTDLQFWRVVHTPKRGNYFLRSRPLVHWGFMKSWTASNLNHRILNRVIQIMHSDKFDKENARVLVTGHSLGGALAVLASHDIATHCGIGPKQITCYTYGAPRVGNHAFAREYDALVPNTWQVINDEDFIPRMPKFLILFKHVGTKAIINGQGDLIVRPHMVEVSLYKMFTFFKSSSSVIQHLLLNYRKSFVAICEAQFIKGKGLEGGMEAMLLLLEERERLLTEGLGVEPSKLRSLHSLGSGVWTKVLEEKRDRRRTQRKKMISKVWEGFVCSSVSATESACSGSGKGSKTSGSLEDIVIGSKNDNDDDVGV